MSEHVGSLYHLITYNPVEFKQTEVLKRLSYFSTEEPNHSTLAYANTPLSTEPGVAKCGRHRW